MTFAPDVRQGTYTDDASDRGPQHEENTTDNDRDVPYSVLFSIAPVASGGVRWTKLGRAK